MQRRQQLLLSFMVWGLVLFCGTTVVAVPTSQEIAKIALGSTVHLGIIHAKGGSTGSGFFVGPNQIATNYHVIEDILNEYTIRGAKLVGKDDIYAIEDVVSFDKKKDLAIVKVKEVKSTGVEVPALTLGDSDAVQIGEKIYVAGNPQGLEGTFSDGIISAIRGDSTDDKLFQMTAPISQGSSGGPVLNEKGEVIGVSVATLSDGQNLNFAIPVNYLKALMPTPASPIKPKPVKPKVSPPPVKTKPVKPKVNLPPVEPKPTLAPQEIAKTALGSTVHLSVRDAKGESWTGSGFVVHDGQIATNYHVIDNMSVGGARLVGKEEIYPIEAILAGDKERDLAVIKVAGIDAPTLPLGDSDTVEVMDTIYVAGNPQGWEGTVVPGNISAIRQSEDRVPLKFFQMTAPISQGSSGGPVLNETGEVIGVSFATHRNGQNLNFAIPVNYLKIIMTTTPTPVKPKQAKVDPPPVESTSIIPQADPPPTERKLVLTPQEIHKITERSTVLLETIDAKGNSGMGSGFIVHDNRIATNYHVIEDMSSGFAKLVGKPKEYRVKVLVFDKERDLAIVKATGIDAPALSLGDSDTVQVADKVYVMGNPHRLEGTFSSGEISAIRPLGAYLTTFPLSGGTSWDWHAPCQLLQMTAPTSKGSSGGPVLNESGEVIGIVFGGIPSFLQPDLTVTTPENLNFAIAVNYLKQLAKGEGIPITPTSPKISPIMKHVPPSKISVGEIIPLTLDLISPQVPRQVTIHYKTYDKNGNELKPNNQQMRLSNQRSASSTWTYKMSLPSQNHVGSIEYYITVEYDNHVPFRYPRDQKPSLSNPYR